MRHYTELLEFEEREQFRNLLVKTSYTLVGSMGAIPYVGYQLYTFKQNIEAKRIRLRNGMLF
jgi:hypothetical protein